MFQIDSVQQVPLIQAIGVPKHWDRHLRAASQTLETALLQMDTELARIRLAQLYQFQGKWEQALPLIENSDHLLGRTVRLADLLRQGKHQEVHELARDLVAHWHGADSLLDVEAYALVYWTAGLALARLQQPRGKDLLEAAARTLCVLGVDLQGVRCDLAHALFHLGDFEGSIQAYRQVIEAGSGDPERLAQACTELCATHYTDAEAGNHVEDHRIVIRSLENVNDNANHRHYRKNEM